ncbi:hypothetical protein F5I97DRAFT_1829710 [Phlebopus sp. FC_14]|nr:hypothetical protein F5I97DRAFT_1829710 [Phlebopus sp. FC_14]
MVKFRLNTDVQFGEVHYYTQVAIQTHANITGNNWHFANVAVIQLFSKPNKDLLKLSYQTVFACKLTKEFIAVDVKNILSVVVMIPHKFRLPLGQEEDQYFMVEKPGLDVLNFDISYGLY